MATRLDLLTPLAGGLLGRLPLTPEEEEEQARLAAEAEIAAYLAANPTALDHLGQPVATEPVAPVVEAPPRRAPDPNKTYTVLDAIEELGMEPEEAKRFVEGRTTETEKPPAIIEDEAPVEEAERRSPSGKKPVVIIEDEPQPSIIEDTPTGDILAQGRAARAREGAMDKASRPVEVAPKQAAFDSMLEKRLNSPEMWDATPAQMRAEAKRIADEMFDGQVETGLADLDKVARYRKQGGTLPSRLSAAGVPTDKDPNAPPSFTQSVAKGGLTTVQLVFAGAEALEEATGDTKTAQRFGKNREYYGAIREQMPEGVRLDDIKDIGDAAQFASQALGEQLPLMAGPMAGAAFGRIVAGSLGAKLGAFGPSYALGVGEVQVGNKELNPEQKAGLTTLAGGAVIAALDSVLPERVGSRLVTALGQENAEKVARRILLMPASALKGAATEMPTEFAQTIIGEIATAVETDTPIQPGMFYRALEAGVTGAVVGGTVGGVTGAVEAGAARKPVQGQTPPAIVEDTPANENAPVARPSAPSAATVKAKIRQAESSGNDNARNPRSSASGRYQFTDGTWAALGGDPAKKNDPAEQERMMDKLTAANQRALDKAGFETNAGNTYLAHFLGAGGAVQALSNPDAPVAAAVQKANPHTRGWTNRQLVEWAAHKMGQPVAEGVATAPVEPEMTPVDDSEYWDDIEEIAQNEDEAPAGATAEAPSVPVEDAPLARSKEDLPPALRESPVAEPEVTAASARASLDEAATRSPSRLALASLDVESAQDVDWTAPQEGETPVFVQDESGFPTEEIGGFIDAAGTFREIGEPAVAEAAPAEASQPEAVAPPAPSPADALEAPVEMDLSTARIDIAALLKTLPLPGPRAGVESMSGRLEGQRAGVGQLDPMTPDELAAQPRAFRTAYNIGLNEGRSALEAATGEFVAPDLVTSGDTTPVAIEGSSRFDIASPDAVDDVNGLDAYGNEIDANPELTIRIEQIDDKLFDLSNEGRKSDVKRYAQRLVRDGVIEQAELDAMAPMFADRDMGAEDIVDELRTSVSIWEAAQRRGEPTTKRRVQAQPKSLADTIPGWSKVAKWLTGEEKAQARTRAYEDLVSIYDSLPSTREITAVALAGREARGWYRHSSLAIARVFGRADGVRFAAVLASTSPKVSVQTNLEYALRIWAGWVRAGRPTERDAINAIAAASAPSAMEKVRPNVTRALTEDIDALVLSGPKVNSFFRNLINDVNELTNDTWIARFMGKPLSREIVRDGKRIKSPEYMAFNARMRAAAKEATRRTGHTWTPVEIQETVWSWAKVVYEMRDRAGENRTIQQMLAAGDVTHEQIANTDNFSTLMAQGVFRNLLEEAGYGEQTRFLGGSGGVPEGERGRGSVTAAEGTGFTQPDFERHLDRAGGRLERSRPGRAERVTKRQVAKSPQPTWQKPSADDVFLAEYMAAEAASAAASPGDAGFYYEDDPGYWAAIVEASATLTGENDNAHYMVIHNGGTDAQAKTRSEAAASQANLGGPQGQAGVGADTQADQGTGQPETGQLELYPGADLGDISLPDFVTVDDVLRPTTNADGQPIAATRKAVTNFWRWFGDSKAVDAAGRPMVFYHGTKRVADEFTKARREWFFFSDNRGVAETYKPRFDKGSVLATYLKVDDVVRYDAEGRVWSQVELSEPDEAEIDEARERYIDDRMREWVTSATAHKETIDGKDVFFVWGDSPHLREASDITWVWGADGVDWPATIRANPDHVYKTEEEAETRRLEYASEEEVNVLNYFGEVEEWELAEGGYLDRPSKRSTDDLATEHQADYDAVWIDDVEDTADGRDIPSTVVIVYRDKLDEGSLRIKSADQNTGEFNPASRDFRRRKTKETVSTLVSARAKQQALATLRQMGLDGVIPLEIVEKFEDDPPGQTSQGEYDDAVVGGLIRIAALATDVRGTTRHEVVHWARDNVWTRDEWSKLAAWAKNDPNLMAWAKTRYPDLNIDEQIEEAVAEGFARWNGGERLGKLADLSIIEAALAKLRDLIRAIREALGAGGLTRGQINAARELLAELESGALAKRHLARSKGPTFGRKPWKDDLSRALLSGQITPQEHQFLRRNPGIREQSAWHGSPVTNIMRFMLDFIGKGEGAQAFGWGLYFAQKKDVADWYRRKLTMENPDPVDIAVEVNGVPLREWNVGDAWTRYEVADRIFDFLSTNKPYNGWIDALWAKADNDIDGWIAKNRDPASLNEEEAAQLEMMQPVLGEIFQSLRRQKVTIKEYGSAGALYKVEVPENEDLLDLDAKLSEQSPKVKKALEKIRRELLANPQFSVLGERGDERWPDFWNQTGMEFQRFALGGPITNGDIAVPKGASSELETAIENGEGAMAASIWMREVGILGARYLDKDSRAEGDGTRNFVIFDDSTIELKMAEVAPVVANGKRRVIRTITSSPLSDPTNPNPGFFRRIHDQTMSLLTALGTAGDSDWENSDNLIDAFRRKVTQRYQQIIKTQRRAEALLGVSRLAPGMNPMEMITADERGYKMEFLKDNMIRPMAREMHSRGVSMDDLGLFLYARHAPARNARVAAKNKEFRGPGKPPGSGMSNEEAAQILSDFATIGKLADLQAVATHIDAMIDFAQQERINGGLLSAADVAAGFQPGDFYVPLRGNEALEPEHEMDFTLAARKGGGFSVAGRESHRMFGRESRADLEEIVGYVVTQAQDAIERSYRNRVGQSIMEMFTHIPDPDFVKIDRVKRVPVLNRATGQITYQMQTRMTDPKEQQRTIFVKVDGDVHKLTFNDHNPSAMRFVKAAKNLGIDVLPAWLRMVSMFTRIWSKSNTQWNPDFILANATKDIQTGALNASTLNRKGLRRAMLKNIVSLKPLYGALMGATHDAGAGFGSGNPWFETFAEFEANGGKLNYGQTEPLDDTIRSIRSELKDIQRSAFNPIKAVKAVGRWIDVANSGFENMTRLAAYKALRDGGVPAKQAAEAVRELTTNFQQHGEWGPKFNAAYGFANASVIGGARFAKTVATNPLILTGLISLGMMEDFLNSIFDDDEWDKWTEEDKHANFILLLPDSFGFDVKIPAGYGLNAFITTGRKMAELWRGKKKKDGTAMGVWDAASDVGMGFVNAFAPITGATPFNILAPTIIDPIVNIYQNQNNWGRPIMPPQAFRKEQEKPDSQLAFENTHWFWKSLATTMNAVGGGNDVVPGAAPLDISPETYKHVTQETVGGAGRSFMRAIGLMQKVAKGEEVGPNDVPIVRRFIGNPYGAASAKDEQLSVFYERLGEARVAIKQAEEMAARYGVDSPTYLRFYEANKPLIDAADTMKEADKRLRKFNAAENAAERGAAHIEGLSKRDRTAIIKGSGKPAPKGRQLTDEEVKAIKAETRARKEALAQEFNEAYRKLVMREAD